MAADLDVSPLPPRASLTLQDGAANLFGGLNVSDAHLRERHLLPPREGSFVDREDV